MPLYDIVILCVIVGAFTALGIVLAAVCWYCRDTANPHRRAAGRPGAYPAAPGLITDDD